MTIWINIFWVALQLVLAILQKIKENELIAQGRADAIKDLLNQSKLLMEQANATRTDSVPGVVVRDEFDRDNDTESVPNLTANSLQHPVPDTIQQQPRLGADNQADTAQQSNLDKPSV